MAKTSSLDWRKAVFEGVAIVFAVLLALWLEGWREDVELRDRADAHLERIRAEVVENREALVAAIAEHESYIAGLDAALVADDLSLGTIGQFLKIEGGATSDAAWRSAQLSQGMAAVISVETLGTLAALYDTQAYYTDYLNFFFQNYIDLVTEIEEGNSGRAPIRKFRQHLSVTNSLAEQLLARYDTFLGSSEEQ